MADRRRISMPPDSPRRLALRALTVGPAALGLRALTGCGTSVSPTRAAEHDAEAAKTDPASAGTLAPTPACHDGDEATPSQTEGPYFKPSSPERGSLIDSGMSGTALV